jgi:hypothetical protein
MDKEIIFDQPSYTKTLDKVRQFLIEITTLDKEKYSDKNLFAFEEIDGIEKCIGT